MTVELRPARPDDVDFLVELANHEQVEPFMGGRQPRDRASLAAEIDRSLREPERFGRLVIEADGVRAGTVSWELVNERSSIVRLERLALHPDQRGRGIADEATRRLQRHLLLERGYHRLELEVYAFNERALAHAQRVGYAQEGLKRRAYWRHGRWNDAVLFSLIADDLGVPSPAGLLREHVRRFNDGVRTGDWSAMLDQLADDAELVFEGVAVGPFRGREAIAEAYRERPPDDEITVERLRERDGVAVADYRWVREPETRAGELRIASTGDRITSLVLTFHDDSA